MTNEHFKSVMENFLSAWTTSEVKTVLGTYTADVSYLDPNTRGRIEGADDLRGYLTKLLSAWEMSWELLDSRVYSDGSGGSIIWRATIKKTGGSESVNLEGMDLVLLENDLVKRNDVFFDRAVLAGLA